MTTSNVHKEIKGGIANAKAHPADFAKVNGTNTTIAPRTLGTHPNRNLQVPVMKTFTVTRQTMDPSQGVDGFISLAIQAVSGAEAGTIADQAVAEINEPFIVKERHPRR